MGTKPQCRCPALPCRLALAIRASFGVARGRVIERKWGVWGAKCSCDQGRAGRGTEPNFQLWVVKIAVEGCRRKKCRCGSGVSEIRFRGIETDICNRLNSHNRDPPWDMRCVAVAVDVACDLWPVTTAQPDRDKGLDESRKDSKEYRRLSTFSEPIMSARLNHKKGLPPRRGAMMCVGL